MRVKHDPTYLTKASLADRYGVSVKDFERWLKTGTFPPADMAIKGRGYWHITKIEKHERLAVASYRPSTESSDA